jgi:hypothetical protein
MAARRAAHATAVVLLTVACAPVLAHDGPPFPIVSNEAAGPYIVSVWTDPDTTDDESPGGQFWLMLEPAAAGTSLPAATSGRVLLRPLDRDGVERAGRTVPVDGEIGRQFVALVMDHEGRFRVRVSIDGPLGPAFVEAEVEGTYDQRPAPVMMLLFLAPFVAVGAIWLRLLRRRSGRGGCRPGPIRAIRRALGAVGRVTGARPDVLRETGSQELCSDPRCRP